MSNTNAARDLELELGKKVQLMKLVQEDRDMYGEEADILIEEGKEAIRELVERNKSLAYKIANDLKKQTGTTYCLEEMTQDALFALVDSIHRYDPEKGCKLTTYAYYRIRKEVGVQINKQRSIRLPENKMGDYQKIQKAKAEFGLLTECEKAKYSSEMDYVSEVTELSEEEIGLIMNILRGTMSLSIELHEGSGTLSDLVEDENATKDMSRVGVLDPEILKLIDSLKEYDRDLIAYEFRVFEASMEYKEFLRVHQLTEKQAISETKRAIRELAKLAKRKRLNREKFLV